MRRVEVYSMTPRYRALLRIAPGASEVSHNILLKLLTDEGLKG